MRRRVVFGMILAGLMISPSLSLLADDITVTTTYPSPRGVYQELRTTNNTYLATSGGNVGIGTSNPLAKFGVQGSVFFQRDVNTDPIELSFGVDANNRAMIYQPANSDDLRFFIATTGGGAADRMTITSTGNIGIATTAPIAPLHVSGDLAVGNGPNPGVASVTELTTGGASPISNRLTFGTDGSGWKFAIGKNQSGTVSDLLTIQDDGNVGIGTTTPGSALGVMVPDGGAIVVGTPSTIVGGTAGIEFNYDSKTGGNTANIARILGYTESGGGGDLLLQTAPNASGAYSTKMAIQQDGNVGIGTTTPQSTPPNGLSGNLDVNDVYLRSTNQWLSQGNPHPNFYWTYGNGGPVAGSVILFSQNFTLTAPQRFYAVALLTATGDEDDYQEISMRIDGNQCGIVVGHQDRADFGGVFTLTTNGISFLLLNGVHSIELRLSSTGLGSSDGPCASGASCSISASLTLVGLGGA